MGYEAKQIGGTLVIPADELEDAFQELQKNPVVQRDLGKCNSLQELFEYLGYEVSFGDSDALLLTAFYGKWRSTQDIVLGVLAPYVQHGSDLKFRGEDGDMWSFVFENGTITELTGAIVWKEK